MAGEPTFNFETSHVQRELVGGSFVNSATILISAGPPYLDHLGDGILGVNVSAGTPGTRQVQSTTGNLKTYPIGVVENMNLSQARQLQRLFEIGSKRSHFVVGRNIGSITLARTLIYGPNLTRVLYAYADKDRFQGDDGWTKNLLEGVDKVSGGPATTDGTRESIDNNPGYADFMPNLDSDLFDSPFGLFFYLESANNKPYGGFYLEEAMINAHQLNVSSSSTIVAEGVTIQFDQLVPINVNAVEASYAINQ
jgi:hypothetical protein